MFSSSSSTDSSTMLTEYENSTICADVEWRVASVAQWILVFRQLSIAFESIWMDIPDNTTMLIVRVGPTAAKSNFMRNERIRSSFSIHSTAFMTINQLQTEPKNEHLSVRIAHSTQHHFDSNWMHRQQQLRRCCISFFCFCWIESNQWAHRPSGSDNMKCAWNLANCMPRPWCASERNTKAEIGYSERTKKNSIHSLQFFPWQHRQTLTSGKCNRQLAYVAAGRGTLKRCCSLHWSPSRSIIIVQHSMLCSPILSVDCVRLNSKNRFDLYFRCLACFSGRSLPPSAVTATAIHNFYLLAIELCCRWQCRTIMAERVAIAIYDVRNSVRM